MIFKTKRTPSSPKYRLVGIFLCTLCAWGLLFGSASATNAQNIAPTVVEIFTSRGCPACPPADRNLKALANKNPDMITLSCHVTYFNRARTTDVFGAPFCDARQNVYKLALKTQKIYTPMVITNGRSVTTGTTNEKLMKGLRSGGKTEYPSVKIALNSQYLDIKLPRIGLSQSADVWLFEYLQSPNERGYTQYQNTVSKITKLMRWDGKPMNMAFPVNPGFDKGFAIIVQDYKSGVITAGKVEN